MLIEGVLVRARDEFVGIVALQLHAKHARQGVRLAAKRDGGHFFRGVVMQPCDTTILIPFSYDRYTTAEALPHAISRGEPTTTPSAQGRVACRKADPTSPWTHP